jgi:hypothetical protein
MRRILQIVVLSLPVWCFIAPNAHSDNKKSSGSKGSTGQNNGVQKNGQKVKVPGPHPIVPSTPQKTVGLSSIHPKNPVDVGSLKSPMKPLIGPLKKVGSNPNVGSGAQSAINTLVSGNFLSAAERQDLTNLVAVNPANLGEDDLKAVQAALDYDARAKREERYLELENATGERLTVWLHYQTFDEEQNLSWLPVKPVDPDKALRYILRPGAKEKLGDGKNRIAASSARVWAESDSGYKWLTYRDKDLSLKPEKKDNREMGSYSLRLIGAKTETVQADK